ncbi:nucleotide excision repair endonuclease [Rhodohalobacter sp. 8-1]|uniref:nucleotide excision repair endonuclease n=1 Tax=Rhodohalobacter sp. 8-1 TaxID=3131972 RepID=UPI0030EC9AF3
MRNETLTLITAKPLLEERLGTDQFSTLTTRPGIYRFYDDSDNLLYVGKAKNLRTRLFSYKRAKPGQVSRKVSRLIGRIARLEIEETDSEQNALLLENRWIRKERPPFNHANKQTEAYYFIYFKPGKEFLEFRLSMRIHDETDANDWYGSFKGHAPVRRSLGCLLQLMWMAEYGIQSPHHLPVQLTRRLTPMRYQLLLKPNSAALKYNIDDAVCKWFLGDSCDILDYVSVRIENGRNKLTPFQTRFLEDRLHHLKSFYDRTLQRYRHLRGDRRIIAQDELDDLVVKAGFK